MNFLRNILIHGVKLRIRSRLILQNLLRNYGFTTTDERTTYASHLTTDFMLQGLYRIYLSVTDAVNSSDERLIVAQLVTKFPPFI